MKKLFDYKNLSIGKKFTVTFCLSLMLPLMLLFVGVNISFSQRIIEENCKTNLAILKQTENALENMIQEFTAVSLEAIGNEDLQTYFKATDLDQEKLEILQSDIKYDLGNTLVLKPQITRLSVFTDDAILFQFGKYLMQEPDDDIPQVRELGGRMYWKAAEKNENYLISRDREEYEVHIYRALNDHYDFRNILGYEKISVAEDYICDMYSGIETDSTREMFIVNTAGQVISSNNKELLGTDLSERGFFSSISGKKEGYWVDKKENTIVSFYYLKDVQWYVVKIDDEAAAVGQEWVTTIIVLCMVMAILFGVVFHKVQKKRIIEPIMMLSRDVSLFKEGDFEIGSYSEAEDEIGTLNNNFIEMAGYIQDLIERVYKSQLKEKEAQLKYLQSQINPHFLYNTLDSMRWMAVKKQQYELAEQIEALSNHFKHALNQGKEMTTAGKELQHLRDYLLIQKNRFGDRVRETINVEEGLENCNVLNLILQPLVENAIVHGIENRIGGGDISVSIQKEDNKILYVVEDNGVGTDQEEIRRLLTERSDSHNAMALDNINQRIKVKYGEEYGVTFFSEIGVGTRVEVRMPIDCEGKNEDIDRR